MLKYFVLVVRDLASCALLLSLILSLARNSRVSRRAALSGILAGAAVSVFLAVVKQNNLIRDRILLVWNLYFLGILFGSLIFHSVFQWRAAENSPKLPKKSAIAEKICAAFEFLAAAALLCYLLPKFFLYPFNFLIKGQSVFSTDYLFKFIGYSLGTLLVFLVFLSFYSVLKSLPRKSVCAFSVLFALLTVLQRIGAFLSPMIVRKWIRPPKSVRHAVDVLMNNEMAVIVLMFAVSFVMAGLLIFASLTNRESYSNPAEHRKIKAKCIKQRRWSVSFVVFGALSILTVTWLKNLSEREITLSPAEKFSIEGDLITIPVEQVGDGLLHRFEYKTADGSGIRFIIIKKNAFAYGVGFDACEICGATGYYQKNGQVICKLCDVVMNINTIGFKGGCNPIPLPYEIRDGEILVRTADLEVEKRRFR